MERVYDVTVDGQPLRLELHSTSVVPSNGRVRIDVHADPDALTDTLPADVALQFDPAAVVEGVEQGRGRGGAGRDGSVVQPAVASAC